MIPPAPRSARPRQRLLAALVVTATVSTLAACGTTPSSNNSAHVVSPDDPAFWVGRPSPVPMAPPAPPVSPELAAWLKRLPKFGDRPVPEQVTVPHNPGGAAWVAQVPTEAPVAFLTIDDGIVRHPMALDLIKAAKVPVALFLTTNYVSGHEDFFQSLKDTGYVDIYNHTVNHANLRTGGYPVAHDQLCTANNRLGDWFGKDPIYYRPPYGEQDASTETAAWECGLQIGFFWRETVDSGTVYYQRDSGHIHPGDVILMHFRPAFPDDFVAALTAIKNSGLTPARLEDYITIDNPPAH